MTPEEAVRALAAPVARLGGAFILDAETLRTGAEHGYPAWSYYYGGRGGVLGDVDADVVTAALGFFPPAGVRKGWEQAAAVAPAAETASRYAHSCHGWGRARLAGVDGLDRLCALAAKVVAAAAVAGVPVFAGWRAMPLPDDAPARAAQLLHVLRELRGGLHLVAVLGSGLTPLEAVVAGRRGADNARFYGWPEPYPEPAPLAAARERAERLTDELVVPAYTALSAGERAELVTLLQGLAAGGAQPGGATAGAPTGVGGGGVGSSYAGRSRIRRSGER